MNDHETVSLACPRLEHFIEQARQYPPLKTAVVDAAEVHVLEGLLKAKAEGLGRSHPDRAARTYPGTLPEAAWAQNIVPGIKVDKGKIPLALSRGDLIIQGLDGLAKKNNIPALQEIGVAADNAGQVVDIDAGEGCLILHD